uniref:Cytochrome b561 domain-containing protein n=1 Tax=Spongospora subterranea TaxID=70186 RepID=A0A0H5QNP4_9EUKA|eukprot:CRZ03618.1 hypothetical protein [Spongospora subterranea]
MRFRSGQTSKAYDILPDGSSNVIWAVGSSTRMSMHQDKGIVDIDWDTASFSRFGGLDRSVVLLHAAMMFIAWLVMVPAGAIVARFFKDDDHRWFRLHRFVMVSAVLLTAVAFIMIVSVSKAKIYQSTHGLVGVLVFVVCLFQPVLAHFRNHVREIWEKQHRFTSVFLYIGALINCFLGASMLASSSNRWIFIVCIIFSFLSTLIAVVVLQSRRGNAKRPQAVTDLEQEDVRRSGRPLDRVDDER